MFPKMHRNIHAKYVNTTKRPINRNLRFWMSVLFVLIILLAVHSWYVAVMNGHRKHPPQPVVVAVAHTSDVPVYLSGLGGVTPTTTVPVKTQINGQLLQVFFKEGQFVKAGDQIAQIDPRPYEAQLMQYEGQLTRDEALLTNAELDLKRYTKLWRQDSVAKQVLDTQASLVKQDEGTVQLDKGLVASTKLNLMYCKITSPVDGRVGLRFVDPGNYVQVSDATAIAVIDTLSPITVVFTLPEDNIQDVLSQVEAGATLKVEAYDRMQNKLLETGTLLTMDNQVDPTTGTVKLKAQFENSDNHLFPNQFVNIKLLVKTLQNAIVVPTASIQHGAQGTFVYVLNEDKTVTARPVVVGVAEHDDSTITSGITPGESVVVEGSDKLTDGAKVTIITPVTDPPPVVASHHHLHRRFAA